MNLTDLETFALVAETGTISAAAQRLKVPKSTVSRRVRRLEDALGHELLRRAPRSVTLTDHGRILHRRSAPSLQELHEAIEALTHADSEPRGTLRITTTPSFGQSRGVVSCIRDYGLKYPKMTVDLQLTNRVVSLIEEGLDIGLRLHTGDLPGSTSLMSRRLFGFGRALYASPDYVAEMGLPSSLDAMCNHRLIVHSMIDSREVEWRYHGQPLDNAGAMPPAKWCINDSATLERFALSGAGIALLPTMEGDAWVARGELLRVLPPYEGQGATVSLVWPASRHLAPRIRAFIDHAVETLGQRSSR